MLKFILAPLVSLVEKWERKRAARTDLPTEFSATVSLPTKDEPRVLYTLLEGVDVAEFRVRAGFVTDLATVPRGLRWVLPQNAAYAPIAMVHDMYCDTAKAHGMFTIRRIGDRAFFRLLGDYGFDIRKYPLYVGVTIGAYTDRILGVYSA